MAKKRANVSKKKTTKATGKRAATTGGTSKRKKATAKATGSKRKKATTKATGSKRKKATAKTSSGAGQKKASGQRGGAALPKKGDKVQWKALPGLVKGVVLEVLKADTTLNGKPYKASPEAPRIRLRSDSGKECIHKPESVTPQS